MAATLYALGAVALWATLAPLGVRLGHLPAFQLTGLALSIGTLVALPVSRFDPRRWRVPVATLALGVYGLFGFHLLLFVALRTAPPVEANLINYLWPLLIVLLTPAILSGWSLRPAHFAAAGLGLGGAVLALAGGREIGGFSWGYLPAFGSAVVWATYSLLTRRVAPFPTAAIGGFCLVSGLLSLGCSMLLERWVPLRAADLPLLALLGLGPLGGAFYLWDRALKLGDPRRIGVLAFATPVASTLLLLWVERRPLTIWIGLAVLLIVAASALAFTASPRPSPGADRSN